MNELKNESIKFRQYENFRGVLLDGCDKDLACVRGVDDGRVFSVTWDKVAPMPDQLAKWRAFCFAVELEGILPAGGNDTLDAFLKKNQFI